MPSEDSSAQRFGVMIAVVAAVGGFLFGADTGVISGANLYLVSQFHLTDGSDGWLTSAVLIGAFAGALSAGRMADTWGRRSANLIAGVIFCVGSVATACGWDFWSLFAGRVVVGLAVGISCVAGPLYISEVSPPERRGAMVSLYQLAITVGILGAYCVDLFFSLWGNWRAMFLSGLFPGLILVVGMFFMPNSPRWLLARGRRQEALDVLSRTLGARRAESSADSIERDLEALRTAEKDRGAMLRKPAVRRALVVAAGLAIFQQVIGINTVIYYAPAIFESAGIKGNSTQLVATTTVGVVNVLATFIAIWLVDRLGRKPLLQVGLAGMALSLGVLGVSFLVLESGGTPVTTGAQSSSHAATIGHTSNAAAHAHPDAGLLLGGITLLCVIVYIACFAFSMGPIVWLTISEIFPLGVRGLGTSVASACNWAANFAVAVSFLVLLSSLGAPMTFLLFGAIAALTILFVWRVVPETKGLSLEEIEARLAARGS